MIAAVALSAGLTAAVPAAAPAADAIFGGHVGREDDPIVLRADATAARLRSTVIALTTTCTGGEVSRRVFHAAVGVTPARKGIARSGIWEMSRNANGRISGAYSRSIDMGENSMLLSMRLSGRLTSTSASGTLSAESTLVDAPTVTSALPADVKVLEHCTTGAMRWATVHRPGVVFGGSTDQGEPFVAWASKRRTRLDELHIGWHAACLPRGGVDFPETFERFPLSRTGRFGDTFTQRYENSSGAGENVYRYDVRGRLRGSSASGTFSAKVTYPDATVCATGARHWTAQST